nr:ribonuclease H-like domain-containing protein [Tanacetum cinerariifolium]
MSDSTFLLMHPDPFPLFYAYTSLSSLFSKHLISSHRFYLTRKTHTQRSNHRPEPSLRARDSRSRESLEKRKFLQLYMRSNIKQGGDSCTQEKATDMYDVAAIKFRVVNVVTDFDVYRYGGGEALGRDASKEDQKLFGECVLHKFHANGTLSYYKARLFANGSSQQLGVDFDETFSPVVKPGIIRTIHSLAIIASLHNEFDMSDIGMLNYFLGIYIDRTSTAKRQHAISRFSVEAEYSGVANVVVESAWLRNLLRELHSPLSTATLIEIDIYFVRDMITAGHVRVLHVPSRYQYAYIFTNGLPLALFEVFRSSLSVRPPVARTARAY